MPNIGPMEISDRPDHRARSSSGRKRLPELGKSLGKGIQEFKGTISGEKSDESTSRTRSSRRPSPSPRRQRRRRPVVTHRAARLRRDDAARKSNRHMRIELSLVEHLDELRARVIVSIAVFGVALALCFWQNHLLLELASVPLPVRPRPADHLRDQRAVHDDGDRLRLRRDHPRAADHPLPALRLPAAGLQQAAAAGDPAPAAADPGPVHRRHRLRLLRRPAGRRPSSCSTSTTPSSTSRCGPRILRLLRADAARLRARLPGPGRDPRGDPARHRQGRAADQEPALRLPRLRRPGRRPARRRPGLDAARDGAADRALRAQHRPRQDLRARPPQRHSPTPRPRSSAGGRSGARTKSICGSASPAPRRRSSPAAGRG